MPVISRRKKSILGPLRTLFNVGAIGDMTDGQLLERFASGGEAAELAFAALVERHGPIVLQTCRAILHDEHEAEDAFQATFLVLVRKSRSLWVRDSLSPWLHQVAYRAARYARTVSARRMAHELRAAEMIAQRTDDGESEDLRAALHEEIERLPERFRIPIVLCDLEGRTHEQAARQLGCPVGTVKSRLARGRLRLKDRLARRGLIVPAGMAGFRLSGTTWAAPAASTTRAAMQVAAGRSLTSVVSPTVLAVMDGVSRGLFMNSLKAAVPAMVMLAALAAAGAGGLAWAGLREPTGDQDGPSKFQASRPPAGEERPQNSNPAEARETPDIQGQWEILYVAGTVAGRRVGYSMPNLIVSATDKTINLPTLTGQPHDPLNSHSTQSYTLVPGLREQVELAQERLEQARTTWSSVERTARKRVLPEATLIYSRTKLNEAEKRLKDAERQRDEGKTAGRSDESWIDTEAGPGAGKALRGIYRLKGDLLTICYDEADRGRPETFAADKPTETLVILRRGIRNQMLESIPATGTSARETPAIKDAVIEPRLKVSIVGDEKTVTGTSATYTITVENSGTAVAHIVRANVYVPANSRLRMPGQSDFRRIASSGKKSWIRFPWWDERLAPGQKTAFSFQIWMERPGIHDVSVEASCDEGLSSQASCKTDVSELAADLEFQVLEQHRVVDVDDFTTFAIRIKNLGTKEAKNILVCAILSKNIMPDAVQFNDGRQAQARWNEAERRIVFPPIDRLAVGKEHFLRIKVKAESKGLGTCRVYLIHDELTDALEDMAAFKISSPR
jgi:RNA polymerase sigma factor (sigma-70 family)